MARPRPKLRPRRRDLALPGHILPTAATMIGVCMTVIALLKLPGLGANDTWVDEILAVASLGFVASATFSYLALRAPGRDRANRWERTADRSFMGGLGLVTLAIIVATLRLA